MKLGDVMRLSKGNHISIEDDKEYIIAGVQNYGAGILNKRKVRGIELNMKKYQLIKPNQLMWCKVDTKNGAFGITKAEHSNSIASTNMALADIDTSMCYPEFIEYLFRISFFHQIITKASSGTTNRKYLTPKQLFENIEIPDFDKNEQLVWIRKVDSIINSGISIEVTHQLDLLKKLRQQLLQDAIQGKLVAQNPNDEPASVLLQKIKAEKEYLINEKKLRKGKKLQPVNLETIPFDIPKNWVWDWLGNICLKITDGTHFSPPNTPIGDYMYVTAKNIKDTGVDLRNITYIDKGLHKEIYARCDVEYGDVLYIKDGATTGVVTINNLKQEFSLLSSVALLKLPHSIYNKYLMFVLRSPFYYNATRQDMSGVAITRVTLEKINNGLIPVPPLDEQHRIVKKLDKLMLTCDALEASIKRSQQQNQQLLQQVLREALMQEAV